MAKIAFIQNLAYEYLGTMYLSAVLKAAGHHVEVFILEKTEDELVRQVLQYDPDIAAFSVTTGIHLWATECAGRLKSVRNVLTIFGGPHPTYFPDLIHHPSVDMLCRGEGEPAIVELADRLDRQERFDDIKNLWLKCNGHVVENDLRHLISDLDSLPHPDRSLYRHKYAHLNKSVGTFMAGRGCPYRCSFCFNHAAQKMYAGLGRYLRLRKPEKVVEEIAGAAESYNLRTIYLQDDTLLLNRKWVTEFADLYAARIGLPFVCLLRADQVDEQSIIALKQAGLKNAFFGIESGDESIRNTLLKKGVTDAQIYHTAALLHKHRIGFRTYNMVGLPGETLEQGFKTLRMNAEIRTDFPWCSIFHPFPGTELGRYACEHDLLTQDPGQCGSSSFFKESIVRSPDGDKLANLQKLFYYGVRFPRLIPLLQRLVGLRPNLLFDLLFLVGYGIGIYGSENLRPREVISMGLRNVRSFFFKG